MEKVHYLAPSPENHGHWVVTLGERPRLTRCYMKKVEGPPNPDHWIAMEKELLDGLTLRRRLREKTAVKKIQKKDEDPEDESEKKKAQMRQVLEEEMRKVLDDPPHLASTTAQLLARLSKAADVEEGEDEEVLQTRIVSQREVLKEWSLWEPPAQDEIDSLITEKQALKPLGKAELAIVVKEAEEKGIRIEYIPSKGVYTKKPGKKGGKRKVRWVVCGNFESKDPHEDTFSSGADAAAFRIMIWASSQFQWQGTVLDVKTAFLNAEMIQKEEEQLLLVLPPPFFVERGILDKDTVYLPLKAVYGFRRSPKLWGDHRDAVLNQMTFQVQEGPNDHEKKMELHLVALQSEPNLWKIVPTQDEEGCERLCGLMMTYVDDLLITGSPNVVKAVKERIQETWKTSDPQDIGVEPNYQPREEIAGSSPSSPI